MSSLYTIKYLEGNAGRMALDGEFFPEALPAPYAALNEARLTCYPWASGDDPYKPACAARLGWNESGIHVLMYALEPIIRTLETVPGGPICNDSCMEFFLSPTEGKEAYFNCEVNPLGVMHLGVGEGRHGRTVYQQIPENFRIAHSVHNGAWWAVSYTVPSDFLMRHFAFTPRHGAKMRGNFYNCGDYEFRSHYGMYVPYDLPKPDYHRPELFPDMLME